MKKKKEKLNRNTEGQRFQAFIPLKLTGGEIEKGEHGPVIKNPRYSTTATLEEAVRNTSEVIEEHRKQYVAGDENAIRRLIKINPMFFTVPWVQAEVFKMLDAGKPFKKLKGREKGSGLYEGAYIKALVDVCVKEKGLTKEKAFKYLRDIDIGLTYERIKEIYYRTENDSRTK